MTSNTRTVFIQERFIFDGILTDNESNLWLKKTRKAGALMCENCLYFHNGEW